MSRYLRLLKSPNMVTDKPLAVNILRIPCKQNPEDMETGSKFATHLMILFTPVQGH